MSDRSASVTVLAVDDDQSALQLLEAGLEGSSERLTVRTEATVEAGLERFRSGGIDCILSDYHMPGRNGIEFLRAVRVENDGVPFILFTKTGDERVASEAITAEATDYVIRETIGSQHDLLAEKIISSVERHRKERELARENRLLRELADTSKDALFTFSGDWQELLFINDEYERLFGQSADSLRSNPESFLDQVHPDDVEAVERAMVRASSGESIQVEYRTQPSEGVQLWVESQCIPVVSDDGTVERLTGFTREITDRKVRERDLARKNQQLEQFSATVAHDLRNPLSIADGHLELARETCDSPHLDETADALARASALLDELLSLAKSGDTIGEQTTVDLEAIVSRSSDNVTMDEGNVVVRDSALFQCDPIRVKEALENLFRNAIAHNDEAVKITVGLVPGGFYVDDDGVGIPESERQQVFESGYSSDRENTGFGLAIVDQIVAAHGWEIDAREGADGGARFEITGVDFEG